MTPDSCSRFHAGLLPADELDFTGGSVIGPVAVDMDVGAKSEGDEESDVGMRVDGSGGALPRNRRQRTSSASKASNSNASSISSNASSTARLVMTSKPAEAAPSSRAGGNGSSRRSSSKDSQHPPDHGPVTSAVAVSTTSSGSDLGKKALSPPQVPPKPTLSGGKTFLMGPSPDPNRLSVLAQTSAQSSVESGPDTTTEGSVYSTTGRESTTAPEEEDEMMMMMDQEDDDEDKSFPPLPALPPEAALEEASASDLLGIVSPAKEVVEHNF